MAGQQTNKIITVVKVVVMMIVEMNHTTSWDDILDKPAVSAIHMENITALLYCCTVTILSIFEILSVFDSESDTIAISSTSSPNCY